MRRWAVVLGLSCVGLVVLGCQRKEASDARPDVYDRNADPHASVLEVAANPDLTGDQVAISRRVERARLELGRAAETTEPTGAATAVEQVKQKLAAALDAVKAGNEQAVAELLKEEDAATLRPIIAGAKEVTVKAAELAALVKDKLSIDIPDDVKSGLVARYQAVGLGSAAATATIDDFKIEQAGANVEVTGPDGHKAVFVPVGSDYRLFISPADATTIGVLGEVITAQKQFMDEVTAGINTGDITAANFEENTREISQRTIAPALGKLKQTALLAMQKAASESLPATQPAKDKAGAARKAEEPVGGSLFQRAIRPLAPLLGR